VVGRSLSYIPEDSKVRMFIHKMLTNPIFDYFIIMVIITSSIQLALDKPNLNPNSKEKTVLYWIDISAILIFTLEFSFKTIAYGFVFNGRDSYLRDFWNILDFIVLLFSYLCLTRIADEFRVIKVLRILRCLRLISRNEGLKVAVRAFLYAIPNIFGITMIMILVFILFGVVCVSNFSGRMFYCTN
jgi:Ion transport protein